MHHHWGKHCLHRLCLTRTPHLQLVLMDTIRISLRKMWQTLFFWNCYFCFNYIHIIPDGRCTDSSLTIPRFKDSDIMQVNTLNYSRHTKTSGVTFQNLHVSFVVFIGMFHFITNQIKTVTDIGTVFFKGDAWYDITLQTCSKRHQLAPFPFCRVCPK